MQWATLRKWRRRVISNVIKAAFAVLINDCGFVNEAEAIAEADYAKQRGQNGAAWIFYVDRWSKRWRCGEFVKTLFPFEMRYCKWGERLFLN